MYNISPGLHVDKALVPVLVLVVCFAMDSRSQRRADLLSANKSFCSALVLCSKLFGARVISSQSAAYQRRYTLCPALNFGSNVIRAMHSKEFFDDRTIENPYFLNRFVAFDGKIDREG